METIEKISFQELTKLPIKELLKGDGLGSELVVETPHKGTVIIPLKEGWLFKTERDADYVLHDIYKLETEAKNYLLEKWLNETK